MSGEQAKLKEMIAAAAWDDTLTAEERGQVESETVPVTVARGGLVCRKGQPADPGAKYRLLNWLE
jgi:CRP/FNR family transcriptional regulator, cyclic AMP receptor protein